MASKATSPAANMLRHSRLFSLPPPLSRPNLTKANSNSGSLHSSDTATLPYPTHQAIETTPEGHHRGDWGLKRPLPKKVTQKTSTPVYRILELDSRDHVTDYESASDHFLTLRKFKEMEIPVYTQDEYSEASPFDSTYHNTAIPSNDKARSLRWRFKGKPINELSTAEFEKFVTQEVQSRQEEFREFVRNSLNTRRSAETKQAALDKGAEYQEPTLATEEQLDLELKRLRHESAELWAMTWRFLDLPGYAPGEMVTSNKGLPAATARGIPSTHPSAGLSYLRTANILQNHPELGPVKHRRPVQGRILTHSKIGGEHTVGIGGVVTKVGGYNRMRSATDQESSQEHIFDGELKGGAKTWVRPRSASIRPDGTIEIKASRAHTDAVAVWEHRVDKKSFRDPADMSAVRPHTSIASLADRRRFDMAARAEQLPVGKSRFGFSPQS